MHIGTQIATTQHWVCEAMRQYMIRVGVIAHRLDIKFYMLSDDTGLVDGIHGFIVSMEYTGTMAPREQVERVQCRWLKQWTTV